MGRGLPIEALRRLIREEVFRAMSTSRRGPIREYSVKNGGAYIEMEGYAEERILGSFAEPFGLATRPPAGLGAVAVKTGGQHVIVGVEDREYRPEVSAGRTILYNAYGQTIELKNDSISLGGGSTPVARQGDSCSHSLSITIGPTTYPVTGTVQVSGGTSEVLVP